jgi:predicted RNase H-like HicB family nuclease
VGGGTSGAAWYLDRAMKFTVVVAPEEPDGYSVTCPAVLGAISQGDSIEETLANTAEAIELCLEVYRDDGTELPPESPAIIAREIEEVLEIREELEHPPTIEARQVEVKVEPAA